MAPKCIFSPVRVFIPFLLPLLSACGPSTPTDVLSPLVGTWTGSLSFSPPGEDWSSVDIVIQTVSGSNRSGQLKPKCCQDYAMTVAQPASTVMGAWQTINVGTSLCGQPTLSVEQYESNSSGSVTAFSASLSGRCPSTLVGSVRFTRK